MQYGDEHKAETKAIKKNNLHMQVQSLKHEKSCENIEVLQILSAWKLVASCETNRGTTPE